MLPLIVSERGCVCFLKDVVATKTPKPLGWDKKDCTNCPACMRGPFSALHGQPGMQQATVTHGPGPAQGMPEDTHRSTTSTGYLDRARSLHRGLPELG
ncbi:hypothetical protein QBC32DRAFT_398920 [Pseudoneurospora amorphoporcata]|uniref:Uncharacterized protein n=1 Tax=Pseudoneurospora amorphoporcata TaxID=241081 RepID=A0AAN6NWK5_9PEZI|nr:hypothetical protein QBC32DRAFT_398920 [Pseudoneurospora amorphoporcata]